MALALQYLREHPVHPRAMNVTGRMNTTVNESNQDPFLPQGVDLDKPSVARVYDYYLGGHTNWAIDREFGDKILTIFPQARPIAQANRQFLVRVIHHLMRRGVRQFIDLGAGVPTMDHIHTIADTIDHGSAKVVYCDNEPVAVAHSQILLEEQGDPHRHIAINADFRASHRLWRQITETGLLDFDEPIAMLMIAVLHVKQPDEHGRDIGDQITAHYRELLPPGSYLAISHATDEGIPTNTANKLTQLKSMYDTSNNSVIWRSHAQIADLFGNFDLLDPGLTWAPSWHPDETDTNHQYISFDHPNESILYAGVGRKP